MGLQVPSSSAQLANLTLSDAISSGQLAAILNANGTHNPAEQLSSTRPVQYTCTGVIPAALVVHKCHPELMSSHHVTGRRAERHVFKLL